MDSRAAESVPSGEERRGRDATSPRQVPRRGWRDVLLRTKRQMGDDDVGLVSAGVAFYLFLALFPALGALISVYALVADPAQIQEQIGRLTMVPGNVRDVVQTQLTREAERSSGTLGWTLAGSVLLALWSSSKGVRALMKAMNIAYGEEEERSIPRRMGIALAFTGGALALAVVALGVIVVVPSWLRLAGLGAGSRAAGTALSWAVLLAGLTTVLAALYRFGPSRHGARWRWISPGAIAAVAIAMAASAGLSLYVAQFGSYGKTYGSLAAVVVVLLWLWISALAAVIGAELNSELEHQTRRDTTTGEPRRPGRRGAYVADTLGQRP